MSTTQQMRTLKAAKELVTELESAKNFLDIKSAVTTFIEAQDGLEDEGSGVLGDGDMLELAWRFCERRGKSMDIAKMLLSVQAIPHTKINKVR